MDLGLERFDVFLVRLDPSVGSEIQKTRPCVVISPDEMNRFVRTVIVAPLTTSRQSYPTRVPCRFEGRRGHVVLDQIWTVDRVRLLRRLGKLDPRTSARVLDILQRMFAP